MLGIMVGEAAQSFLWCETEKGKFQVVRPHGFAEWLSWMALFLRFSGGGLCSRWRFQTWFCVFRA